MNIYFACSITGGRDFERVYQEIVRALEVAGHLVHERQKHRLEREIVPGQVERARPHQHSSLSDLRLHQRRRAIVSRQRAREALQKAHDELEQRIALRTIELYDTNQELMREIGERTYPLTGLNDALADAEAMRITKAVVRPWAVSDGES